MRMLFGKKTLPRESAHARRTRAARILRALKKAYPKAKIALSYKTPAQLLVAVILSAQATDKKVNKVTAKLFKKYNTARDFAAATPRVFEKEIRQTGFYRAKAKHIISAAKLLEREFGGHLPKTMEEMMRLPGVARKTANIVLGNAYGIIEGIAVDTHVQRIAGRLGLTRYAGRQKIEHKKTNPNKIEEDLMRLYPKKEWLQLTYFIIEHGRSVCAAKKPSCNTCPLAKLCPSAFMFRHFNNKPQSKTSNT